MPNVQCFLIKKERKKKITNLRISNKDVHGQVKEHEIVIRLN